VAPVLLLAGCMMVGPDFTRPHAPLAAKWRESGLPEVATTPQEDAHWWTVFNDPVLTRLIQSAYAQNLPLRQAGVRVLQARAQLGVALGEFYPQQQVLTSNVSYNRLPVSIPYLPFTNNYWQASFGAAAGWEIDIWGKLRRAIQSADDSYLASIADYDNVLVSLTADVAANYVQLRTLQKQIVIARANVEREREAVAIARARFEGGVVSERDVDQALNVLTATEATVPQLTIQIAQAKNEITLLLGLPPGQLDGMLAGPADIPIAPARVAVGIPADLLRRRPDIRAAELQAAAQCAQIGFAKADLYPTFTLTGNVGTISTNVAEANLGDLFNAGTLAYNVGPALQWNILNYGQITNNVRVQDAAFQGLLINYQNTVLKAQAEVENALALFIQSRKQADDLSRSVQAATGALNVAMIQYTQGIADFTTVLTAEQNLFQAQNNLAVAMGNIPQGLIAAYRAMGGGWQIRQGHDLVPAQTREEMARRTNWSSLLTPVDLLQPRTPGLPSPKDEGPLVRPPQW